jgi:hypothetical protein
VRTEEEQEALQLVPLKRRSKAESRSKVVHSAHVMILFTSRTHLPSALVLHTKFEEDAVEADD